MGKFLLDNYVLFGIFLAVMSLIVEALNLLVTISANRCHVRKEHRSINCSNYPFKPNSEAKRKKARSKQHNKDRLK